MYGGARAMVSTRRMQKRATLQGLPLEPSMLAHVLSALSLHHGRGDVEAVSAVCHGWRERVEGMFEIEVDPIRIIGELRNGDKPYRFDRPQDCLFLPNGDICVADTDNFRLQIVSRSGFYVREVRLDGGTSCPTGVAFAGEHLYVVEHGAHRICKLRHSSSSGHRHAVAGSWGGGDGELRHPWGVAVAAKRVYVTDQGNDRVCVFDADRLKFLFSFGERGRGLGQLHEPRGIAAHGTELFVADYRNHRLVVFDTSDAANMRCPPLRLIGGGASCILGRFDGPSGVCVSNGKLHVAEVGGKRLQVLTLDGLPLQSMTMCGPCAGVAADERHVCATNIDGEHALSLFRLATRQTVRRLF